MSSTRAPKPPSASWTSTRTPGATSAGADEPRTPSGRSRSLARVLPSVTTHELAGGRLERRPLPLDRERGRATEALVRALDAPTLPLEREPRRGAQPLGRPPEPLGVAIERPSDAAAQPVARAVEPIRQLRELRDDELPRHRRRGRAYVGGEVAERRVLLVAHRGDDRHRARGDRPDEPLVAERQQILEAAAAAGEDDHVDVRLLAERVQRVDDRRAPRAGPGRTSRRRGRSPAGSGSGSS